MKPGQRVRLIGKKRMAYVRHAQMRADGVWIQLTKPLGGFMFYLATELECV